MAKRSYNRRTDEEIINDLEKQVQRLESKMAQRGRSDMAVVKAMPRLKRNMTALSQLCIDNGRSDMANTILAFVNTITTQVQNPVRK